MLGLAQTCAQCGFENPRAFRACAACGASLTAVPRATGQTLLGQRGATVVMSTPLATPAEPSIESEVAEIGSDEVELDSIEPPPPTVADDLEPPIVGQDEASEALRVAIESAFASGLATLVALEGEEGSGRTRLLFHAAELAARIVPDARVLFGGCRSDDGVHAPFPRLLLERFNVTPSSSPLSVRAQIATTVGEVLHGADAIQIGETAHLLGHLAGIPFPDSPYLTTLEDRPDELRSRSKAALRRFIEGDSKQRPTVILLDNMHHAEDAAWDLLSALLQAEGRLAVVIAGSQPIAERAGTLTAPGGVAVGSIAPLTEADVSSMLHILLPALTEAPEPLVAALTHRSRGNPAALRELVFGLVEGGLFVPTANGIVPDTARFESGTLPVSIEDAIRARLQRLDDLERATLDRAAVVGEAVWDRAILAMMRSERLEPGALADPHSLWPDDDDEQALDGALRRLVEKGFLERNTNYDFVVAGEYRFVHRPTRELLVRLQDDDVRAQRHGTVAEWITTTLEVSREGVAALAAPHLEKAGQAARAGRAYLNAAREDHANLRTESALRLIEKALSLLSPDDIARRLDALHLHGSLLTTVGRYDEAIQTFAAMLRISWRMGARGRGGAALNRIARVHRMRGEDAAAETMLTRSLSLFRAASDVRGVASSLDDLAQVERSRGNLDTAFAAAKEALEIRRAHGDARGEAVSLATIGSIQHSRGDLDAAEAAFRDAHRIRESIGDRVGTMASLNAMAAVLFQRGDKVAAEQAWRAALHDATAIADLRMQMIVLNNLGESLAQTGRPLEAQAPLLEAARLSELLDDRRTRAEVERNLGLLRLALDEDDAIDTLVRALRFAEEFGGKEAVAQAHVALGKGRARTVFDAAGAIDRRAEESFAAAIDLYRELGNDREAARVTGSLGQHLAERGEFDVARERLREARASLRRLGDPEADRLERILAGLG